MTKKYLVFIFILFIIATVGYLTFYPNSSPKSAVAVPSMRIDNGMMYRCEVKDATRDSLVQNGTVKKYQVLYFYGYGKWYMSDETFYSNGPDQEHVVQSNILVDKDVTYGWNPGAKTGRRVEHVGQAPEMLNDPVSEWTEKPGTLSDGNKIFCKEVTRDPTFFSPPADVQFVTPR